MRTNLTKDNAAASVMTVLNRFAGWIMLAAIIWLCWGIARVLWLILAPPQAPQLPLASLVQKQQSSIDASSALAIFEQPATQQTQAPPPDVKLAGVMLAEPSLMSSAMLQVNGIVQNYRIGEALEDTGYTLVDVSWNKAIIESASGRQIDVELPARMPLDQSEMIANNANQNRRPNANNSMAGRSSNGSQGRSSLGRPAPGDPDSRDNNMINGSSDIMRGNPETSVANEAPNAVSALDNAVSQLKQNPANYLSNMGVMATGEGYQVTDAMPAKLRNRLGLEAGDKVLSVNGQNVGSNPAGDADLLNQVKESGQATIEVQRGEQLITLRQQF